MVNQRGDSADFVLFVLVAGALFVGATWLGVQVAAYIFAGRWCNAGVADAVAAFPRLLLHPRDPGRAWPSATRDMVPGPRVYWPIVAPFYVVAVIATAFATRQYARWAGTSRRRLGVV